MFEKDYEFETEKNERVYEMKKQLIYDLQHNSADTFFKHLRESLTKSRSSNFETMEDTLWNEFISLIRETYALD